MKHSFDETFWEQRYLEDNTGWDIGYVSTPIKEYIDQLHDKSLKILIPGAGNSYEAEYLYHQGFKNTTVVDISKLPLNNLKSRMPEFPDNQLIHSDFFELKGQFDLIIEQTFFCALPPASRPAYAKKMHDLLKPNGKLAGLLFSFPLTEKGPPFGGSPEEYTTYFEPYFNIKVLELSRNSIPPRQGNELFFIFEKKKQNDE